LFSVLFRVGVLTRPECVSLTVEEHDSGQSERVRFVARDHRQSPAFAVILDYETRALVTGQLRPEEVPGAVVKLVELASGLLLALRAVKVGKERIEQEIDYSDPQNLIGLLEARGCKILDEDAVRRAVAQRPGPVYYGDIDLADDGTPWSRGGGPWADLIEERLLEAEAISRP
jgi:hypothetical protein